MISANRRELVRIFLGHVCDVMGPGDPRGGMRFPFGRPAVTERKRSVHGVSGESFQTRWQRAEGIKLVWLPTRSPVVSAYFCGSHSNGGSAGPNGATSKGSVTAWSIDKPPQQISVRIDAPVAQEGPVRASGVHNTALALHQHQFFLVV